jgi:hypothetical protein
MRGGQFAVVGSQVVVVVSGASDHLTRKVCFLHRARRPIKSVNVGADIWVGDLDGLLRAGYPSERRASDRDA